MPVSCMENRPLQTPLITFQSAQGGKGMGSQKGETIPRQQVRMKLRQLWEHEGKKPYCISDFTLLHYYVSLATFSLANLLSWQGSRTKRRLSNTWAWSSFYSFRKGKQHISILTQWTLLLQSCLINHRSYKHMENTHSQIPKNTNKADAVIGLLTMRLSA